MTSKNVETSQAWTKTNDIVLCASKRLHPLCRSCQQKIDSIRVGMIYKHKDGFILMRWYHLDCVSPLQKSFNSADIEGLDDPDVQPFRNQIEDWLSTCRRGNPRPPEKSPRAEEEEDSSKSPLNKKKPCLIDSPATREAKVNSSVPASPVRPMVMMHQTIQEQE